MAANSSHSAWRRALERTASIGRDGPIFPALIDRLAEQFGPAPALISEHDSLSYRELAERSRRYAGWASAQGLRPGGVVCLMLPNCPDYLALWLGITRAGGIAALVNTRMTGAGLTHCLNVVAPRHVVVAAEFAEPVAAVRPFVDAAPQFWSYGATIAGMRRFEGADAPIAAEHRAPASGDTALYIYTSGTTGLPKAARISHRRIMQWSLWFAGMMDTRPDDRMYDCLPMYHSLGGVAAPGAVLAGGGAVVLREGFSARRFWDDVVDERCTLFQYVGELCRYLAASSPHPKEREHRLRLCVGNGLRADVWEAFERRFHIPQILEFYAATEGAVSLYNCEGRRGAIGHIPAFLRHRLIVELIAVDAESGEPLRDAAGLCRRCLPDEPGEAIRRIAGDGRPGAHFEGYTDAAASAQKILRDVFAKGDAWFRTGDLMRRDAAGWFWFVDRLGDTFRWKGENVSTSEVEMAIRACPGVGEVVVYGVEVPGVEGRAGMAAIVPGPGFDLVALRCHLSHELPDYARPLFLRMLACIEVTGTYRPVKHRLAREGYDPAVIADALHFDDRVRGEYVPLDPSLYTRICAGELRL